MPENTKRSGCGCGGCLLFCFYSVVILLGGMFLSNLVDTDWDANKAKDKLIRDTSNIALLIKNITMEVITGEESADLPADNASVETLIQAGDDSYNKAMALLKKAREVTGEARQKILRELQGELQKSLNMYAAAEARDKNNPDLQKKIAHLKDLLAKMEP